MVIFWQVRSFVRKTEEEATNWGFFEGGSTALMLDSWKARPSSPFRLAHNSWRLAQYGYPIVLEHSSGHPCETRRVGVYDQLYFLMKRIDGATLYRWEHWGISHQETIGNIALTRYHALSTTSVSQRSGLSDQTRTRDSAVCKKTVLRQRKDGRHKESNIGQTHILTVHIQNE